MRDLCLIGCLLILCGCVTQKLVMPGHSYVLSGRNYTIAVYNNGSRLLTHPLKDLDRRLEDLDALKEKDPDIKDITDIYVISHGWNFTLQEAYTNYHSYIELVDRALAGDLKERDPEFHPYFIFIAWPSVTRPITDIAKAVLPFGLDRAISPLTVTLDTGIFFLPTVWRQSIDATTNALGHHYPNYYLYRNWDDLRYSVTDDEDRMGRDLPVSFLLYELLKRKKGPLANTAIHCVGHSHGAKLLALATTEALRRLVVETLEPSRTPADRSGARALYVNGDDLYEEYRNRGTATLERPIESLILLNPAFHPRELEYVIDKPQPWLNVLGVPFRTFSLLHLVPRKGIVYSNYDFANGLPFNLSQVVMNNRVSQRDQINAHELGEALWTPLKRSWCHQQTTDDRLEDHEVDSCLSLGPVELAGMGISGLSTLGDGAVSAALIWSAKAVLSIIPDTFHYLGLSEEEAGPAAPNDTAPETSGGLFPLWGQPADRTAIFRLSTPALGRTGLSRLPRGRWFKSWDLEPLQHGEAPAELRPEIPASTFCRLGFQPRPEALHVSVPEKHQVLSKEKIYSYDASSVYNSRLPPFIGAHGDVRSTDRVSCLTPNEGLRAAWDRALTAIERSLREHPQADVRASARHLYADWFHPIRLIGAQSSVAFLEAPAQVVERFRTTRGASADTDSPLDRDQLRELLERGLLEEGFSEFRMMKPKEKREYTLRFIYNFSKWLEVQSPDESD